MHFWKSLFHIWTYLLQLTDIYKSFDETTIKCFLAIFCLFYQLNIQFSRQFRNQILTLLAPQQFITNNSKIPWNQFSLKSLIVIDAWWYDFPSNWHITHSSVEITGTQCENYVNLLPHFFDKNFVKTTLLLKKSSKSWFHEIFFRWQ